MKRKMLLPSAFLTVMLLCQAPPMSRADEKESQKPDQAPEVQNEAKDKEDDADKEQEPDADSPDQLSPEEFKERMKKKEAADKATVAKMMKVFSSLEGEWTGQEELKFEDASTPPLQWKDQWKGVYTMGSKYFEMTGKTAGEDMNSEYKWICTYDVEAQRYRAWYFGDNAINQYVGMLSEDGKHVVWRTRSRVTGAESEFTMQAEGNRLKCRGTDTLPNGDLFSTQTSEYTRKRVDL
ncbi:MAG: hypothetical protein JWM59_2039 [Verrucomicrobiales bacterium]|nr:hypothetical protein [Verrucomicrobiales bacterium]